MRPPQFSPRTVRRSDKRRGSSLRTEGDLFIWAPRRFHDGGIIYGPFPGLNFYDLKVNASMLNPIFEVVGIVKPRFVTIAHQGGDVALLRRHWEAVMQIPKPSSSLRFL